MTTFTAQQLANPAIDRDTLAMIVNDQPELWEAVLAHPNCYDSLAGHIRRYLPELRVQQKTPVPMIQPPTLGPGSVPGVPEAWSAPGTAPGTYSVPIAPAATQASQPTGKASVQQMSAGAQQLATGAKDFLAHTCAPAAKRAGVSLQQAVQERRESAPAVHPVINWAPIALPLLGVLGIVSLFLPVATVSAFGYSEQQNFFDEEAEGGGVMLLVILLIATGCAVLRLVLNRTWARITAGVVCAVVAVLSAIIGFGALSTINDFGGASAGAGIVMLTFAATAMGIAAGVTLFTRK